MVLVCLLAVVFIFPSIVISKEVKLTFQWSSNTEPDMAKYAIFQRVEGQAYDYTSPIDPLCTIVDGKCYVDPTAETCEFEHTFIAPDGEITTFYFVARAGDSEGFWSADSNEVFKTYDLAPIVAAIINEIVYNNVTNTIDLSFSQADSARVSKWELFMSNTSGGPYTKVDTIDKVGEGDTFLASWAVSGDGDYYFTLVTFTPEGVFSSDSNEKYIKIESPSPVKDFKIKIDVQ